MKGVQILAYCAYHRNFCECIFFGVELLANLVLGMQSPVLPVLGQRQLASLSTQMEHRGRQRKKWRGGHKQEKQSNRWM